MENRKFHEALREYRQLLQLQARLSGLKDAIIQLRRLPNASLVSADIALTQMNYQALSDSASASIKVQEGKLESLASEIFDSYKTQLSNYIRQAQFGFAQVIEHASVKSENP